jgi:ADYC domain
VGFNLTGLENSDGVRLVPELVQAMPPPPFVSPDKLCPEGARLDVQDGSFVGTLEGAVVCSGAAMLGMAFWIHVTCQPNVNPPCRVGTSARALIRISESSQLDTWHLTGAMSVPTYRLVWHTLALSPGLAPEAREGASICPRREAAMEPWQGVKPSKASKAWTEATDHVLLVQGEHYGRDAAVTLSGRDWINLACVGGTALAKMRLLGYDPMNTAQSKEERQSTLKMLTARYLGRKSYTRAGVPLMWKHRDATRQYYGEPEEGSWSESRIEAIWDGDGAICVSDRRTWLSEDGMNAIRAPQCQLSRLLGDARRTRQLECAMPEETNSSRRLRAAHGPGETKRLGVTWAEFLAAEQRSLQSLRGGSVPRCAHDALPRAFWTTYPVSHAPRPSP